ncbi:tudor domain-containing protein 10 isoform X2 [Hyperolius riggenbachi]|uniref:tudor domain-containing protein 10 isoform X2 n=1 Tax=Hyperolius riggenbachi TaxID=752182 RepID=UPI0035A35585
MQMECVSNEEKQMNFSSISDDDFRNQIFINNLSTDTTKNDLKELLKDFVLRKVFLYHREKHSFAFVTLSNADDVQLAISKIHHLNLKGQQICCYNSNSPKRPAGSTGIVQSHSPIQAWKELPDMEPRNKENAKGCVDLCYRNQVFVTNLPRDTDKADLQQLFTNFGVKKISIFSRDTHSFAFMILSSQEDVQLAISTIHESDFKGRPIRCYVYTPRCPKSAKTSAGGPQLSCPKLELQKSPDLDSHPEENTEDSDDHCARNQIFISNLPPETERADLEELFKDFEVQKLYLYRREFCSFAFITLSTWKDAQLAIRKFHHLKFLGCHISCHVSKSKKSVNTSSAPSQTPSLNQELEKFPDLKIPSKGGPYDSVGTKKYKLFVDNLPGDVTEEVVMLLFEHYKPINAWTMRQDDASMAIVEVASYQNMISAVKEFGRSTFKGRLLNLIPLCTTSNTLPETDTDTELPPMPALEPVPQLHGNGDGQTDEQKARALFLIPVEMKGALLTKMLQGCLQEVNWLTDIMRTRGDVSLFVTYVYPRVPYFWALPMTEETCTALAELRKSLEMQNPCQKIQKVQSGQRGVAQCKLTEADDGSWSRCWVAEVFCDYAVVFFLDYGVTEVILTSGVYHLEDQYWVTPPLAQPYFMLEGPEASDCLRTTIYGTIRGTCPREPHILNFVFVQKKE